MAQLGTLYSFHQITHVLKDSHNLERKLQKLLFISLEMDHIEIGIEGTGDECVSITTIYKQTKLLTSSHPLSVPSFIEFY